MKVTSIRTTGLGDATYLLSHGGVGVVVDPQRDIDRFEQAVSDAGVELAFVLETHLHNDYISGGRDLAARTGAGLVLPAAGGVAFDHVPAFHKEDLPADTFTVRPLHTPGHTPEHMSYLVLIDDHPAAVFSGGSLLVGSAGRPDLLGRDRAEQLARLQYRSVNRLAALPDDVGLYPTHGEGSFCTASGAGRSTSTIGMERTSNPVLQYPDVESFVAGQLSGLQPYPDYYAHMGPINLMGPEPLPDIDVPEIEAVSLPGDAALVDIRPREAFAAGHIPGSVGIEMGDRVGVWAGWLLPFDAVVFLVAQRGQDVVEVAKQFARIGFDRVAGVVYDLDPWAVTHGPLASFETRTSAELSAALASADPPQILDVRSPGEWEIDRLEGSVHGYAPDLRNGVPDGLDRDRDVWIVCETGFRATAASIYLESAGFRPVVVTKGGVPDVLHAAVAGATD